MFVKLVILKILVLHFLFISSDVCIVENVKVMSIFICSKHFHPRCYRFSYFQVENKLAGYYLMVSYQLLYKGYLGLTELQRQLYDNKRFLLEEALFPMLIKGSFILFLSAANRCDYMSL